MSNKLMVNNTLMVKGAVLDINDMMRISKIYRLACVQEYVFESAKDDINEDDALKIAKRAIELMDKYSYCEDVGINEARKALGYAPFFV